MFVVENKDLNLHVVTVAHTQHSLFAFMFYPPHNTHQIGSHCIHAAKGTGAAHATFSTETHTNPATIQERCHRVSLNFPSSKITRSHY